MLNVFVRCSAILAIDFFRYKLLFQLPLNFPLRGEFILAAKNLSQGRLLTGLVASCRPDGQTWGISQWKICWMIWGRHVILMLPNHNHRVHREHREHGEHCLSRSKCEGAQPHRQQDCFLPALHF